MTRSLDIPASPTTNPTATPAPELSPSLSINDWLNQGADATKSAIATVASQEPALEEQRFLRFVLSGSETALLPLESINEVSQVPSRSILPVPEVAEAVLGIANCRGAILWLVDLATFIGTRTPQAAIEWSGNPSQTVLSHHTITIEAEGQRVGLVVPAVMDIEAHGADNIQQPNAELFPNHLLPFLAGYLERTSSPVLSARALLEHLQTQR